MDSAILWQPSDSQIKATHLDQFRRRINKHYNLQLDQYADLFHWSVNHAESFWSEVWDFCGVIGEKGETICLPADTMQETRWFPEARLNFAENLLKRNDQSEAIAFYQEDYANQSWSWSQLYQAVSQFAQYLQSQGVQKGDRVGGYLPNIPETIVAMLATASLGGVWTSTSPDFGAESVIERFGQTQPKVLISVNGYRYNGKNHDIQEKVTAIKTQIPSIQSVVIIPFMADIPITSGDNWHHLLARYSPVEINFVPVAFNDPLYVLYSSGTTGQPKCIVHSVGGVLLQHLKEHQLHSDIHAQDRVFYFTTCGWMMWNWLVTALASQATVVLYEGSPFYPDGEQLWRIAEQAELTLFGTSAKYLEALEKENIQPKHFNLSSLRTLCSTGSVLSPEQFDYVYQHIKSDLTLASIAGGTDICSCFILGNPISPVRRGECMGRGLGMAVDVFDDDGQPCIEKKGELVCTKPFPAQPIGFWNDPSGEKYHKAYFSRFKNIWHHGDYVRLSEEGGMTFFGRSDAVLNPGGVRIGTAEIYRYVEQLPEIQESIVVGQDWHNDVRVILFVVLKKNALLDEPLRNKIKATIRRNCTPRHVPAKILSVSEIPRTKSGKLVELAVREVIHNRSVKNIHALANPSALAEFAQRAELEV